MSDLLLFSDTETTGLPDFNKPADAPGQPRVASLAGILVRVSDRKVMGSFDLRVRPDGWTMPAELEWVHGLTTELLELIGHPIGHVLNTLLLNLERGDGVPIVFHNASFDLKMLRGELRRAGLGDRYTLPHVCTYKACPIECKHVMGNQRLGSVYKWLTGQEPRGAHTAMGDALMVREIYFKLLDRGVDLTPRVYQEK